MIDKDLKYVSYKQVYDLVFRARNARLKAAFYALDFYDWIKAGVAFNTRGFEVSTRKISYFAQLYHILKESEQDSGLLEMNRALFSEALVRYYEDIYEIYQDYLRSKQEAARAKTKATVPDFEEVIVLSSFDLCPAMKEIFPVASEHYSTYECQNEDKFREDISTGYLDRETPLYTCMSLYYDYGIGKRGDGVLLEVTLWDKA